jgi:hypothetical protein
LRFNRLYNPEFELAVIICLALDKASVIELPAETADDEAVVDRPLTSLDGVSESVLVLVDLVLLLLEVALS